MSFRILTFSLLAASALFGMSRSFAAPPVDLSDYDGAHRVLRRVEKPLTDKDLIFTDNIIKPEKLLHGLVLVKTATLGRTEANTKAKAVLSFKPEYRVRFLQYSKDKKWIAIELLNGRKRAWVQSSAVEVLDENYTKDAPAPAE
ncbi:MAG: hypothetical protein ABIR96_00575 [Bdellovibrionota bacterium]